MLTFEGDKSFPQPQAEVWEKLSDARFLAHCIPGLEDIQQSESNRLVGKLRPGFAFVHGTLELQLDVAEATPPSMTHYAVRTKGIGSTSEVEALLKFAPVAGGTKVHWQIDVTNLGGLLKALPQGLIKAAAQKVIADALSALENQLAVQS